MKKGERDGVRQRGSARNVGWWFALISVHAWTDSSIGWHLDLIHRLLKIKETDTGGVSNEKYKTHKKER